MLFYALWFSTRGELDFNFLVSLQATKWSTYVTISVHLVSTGAFLSGFSIIAICESFINAWNGGHFLVSSPSSSLLVSWASTSDIVRKFQFTVSTCVSCTCQALSFITRISLLKDVTSRRLRGKCIAWCDIWFVPDINRKQCRSLFIEKIFAASIDRIFVKFFSAITLINSIVRRYSLQRKLFKSSKILILEIDLKLWIPYIKWQVNYRDQP